ncbi:MAG: hypothetical protein M0R47_16010 [Methylobacter sp.]|uniref:hypothetical protein n=1 Tax=Methylobacter sp. TaxID=2051955 RepID=UPI0025DEB4D2|nr:hypothetical protein [Methylobacter sp.]MCK9622026.1 hypothetical protein [Methylobacter sp.]
MKTCKRGHEWDNENNRQCNYCMSIARKKYREENREKQLEINKKYNEENKEKISARKKKYREENREKQ